MRKTMLVILVVCLGCASEPKNGSTVAVNEPSYYVSATGNDLLNDGLSEDKPFKTLQTALVRIQAGIEPMFKELPGFDSSIKKITVIGTLDIKSEDLSYMPGVELRAPVPETELDCVFNFASLSDTPLDVFITGKPGASGSERAVLSAKGSGKEVIWVVNDLDGSKISIRFEHIEISGGEGEKGAGIFISGGPNGASVTLGQGAVIRGNGMGVIVTNNGKCFINWGGQVLDNSIVGILVDNEGDNVAEKYNSRGTNNAQLILGQGAIVRENETGIVVQNNGECIMNGGQVERNSFIGVIVNENGKCVINDGEVRDNVGSGVIISKGVLTMRGGKIKDNHTPNSGGGVAIDDGGTFTMSGGTISGNRAAEAGGGVVIFSGSRFDQTGGTISGNITSSNGGGVVIDMGAIFTMSDGTITGNKAVEFGGGVFGSPGGFDNAGGSTFIRVIPAGKFEYSGGRIYNNTAGQGSNSDTYPFTVQMKTQPLIRTNYEFSR